mgnify:CR=1 FL=1
MAVVKSKLLKQISDNYPNFLKKDLENFLNIVLNEIKLALHKGENVEFRDFGTWSVKTSPQMQAIAVGAAQIIEEGHVLEHGHVKVIVLL